MAKSASKTGRPQGAKTAARDEVTVATSRCRRCGSTKRTPYVGSPRVQEYAGIHDGREFTRIIRRRTTCVDCGQARLDRSYE